MNYPTPRSTIAEMVRYQPNLSVNKSQRVIRLSANEGAFGPSPKAKAVLTNIGENMHWYPEEEPLALAEALGKKYNLDPSILSIVPHTLFLSHTGQLVLLVPPCCEIAFLKKR